jgi:hypothetical protein
MGRPWARCAVGMLALGAGGCVARNAPIDSSERQPQTKAATTPSAPTTTTASAVDASAADASTERSPPASGLTPTEPPSASEDARAGCIADAFQHAVPIIVEQYGGVIAHDLERPVTSALFTQPGDGCTSIQQLPDLDGDGLSETEVAVGCHWGMYGWLHLLYFSNQGCLSYAGALVESELRPLETLHDGVRDLEARWSSGCAGEDFRWTLYHWKQGAYRVVDRADCQLCSDPGRPRQNRHRYCIDEARARDAQTAP